MGPAMNSMRLHKEVTKTKFDKKLNNSIHSLWNLS